MDEGAGKGRGEGSITCDLRSRLLRLMTLELETTFRFSPVVENETVTLIYNRLTCIDQDR